MDKLNSTHKDLYYLSVIKDGDVTLEKYYRQYSYPNYLVNIKSVSKILLALGVGLAIEDKKILDVNEPINKILDCDADMTIADLLEMRGGVRWDESGQEFYDWLHSRKWLESYVQKFNPSLRGEKFFYATPNAYILSVLLAKVSNMKAYDYISQKIFEPLGITKYFVQESPEGYEYGGSEFYIAPRDLVKVTKMLLDKGKYQGNSIVPYEWIKECFSEHVRLSESLVYGYFSFGYRKNNEHIIWVIPGTGGQYLFYYPERKIGVVCASMISDRYSAQDPLQMDIFKRLLKEVIALSHIMKL